MTAESRNELGLALQSSCHMWKKSSPLCLSPPCEALLYLQLILTELLGGRKMPKGRGGTRTACEGRTELVGYSSSYYFRDVPGAALTELKTTRSLFLFLFFKVTKIWYKNFENSNSKPCGNFQKFSRTNHVTGSIYGMSKEVTRIYTKLFPGIITWRWRGDTFGETWKKRGNARPGWRKEFRGTNYVTNLRLLWLNRNKFSPGLCDTGALRIQVSQQ